jgi:hypothetical protein
LQHVLVWNIYSNMLGNYVETFWKFGTVGELHLIPQRLFIYLLRPEKSQLLNSSHMAHMFMYREYITDSGHWKQKPLASCRCTGAGNKWKTPFSSGSRKLFFNSPKDNYLDNKQYKQ